LEIINGIYGGVSDCLVTSMIMREQVNFQ